MKSSSGQALLETVLLLPCAMLLFVCFLSLAYAAFARAWIGYQTDRALFCLAEGESEFQCKKNIESSVNEFLPFGRFHHLQLSSNGDQWLAEVDWRWNQIRLQKQKTLKWDSSIWR